METRLWNHNVVTNDYYIQQLEDTIFCCLRTIKEKCINNDAFGYSLPAKNAVKNIIENETRKLDFNSGNYSHERRVAFEKIYYNRK